MKAVLLALLMAGALPAAGAVLTLEDALARAERLSPEVQMARLRIVERQAAEWNATAAYRPQANAVITQAYQTNNIQGIGLVLPGLSSRLGPYRYFNARPVVSQTVIDLSLLAQIRAAKAYTTEAEHDAVVVREQALLAVVQIYLQALQSDSRVAAAKARLQTAEAVWKQTGDLQQNGAASKLDLARAEQQLETERTVAIQARRDREVLGSLLLRAIGSESDEPFELEIPALKGLLPPDAGEAVAEALAERPELHALAARNRAAAEEKTRAQRERLPKVSVEGDFGLLGQGPDHSLSTYRVAGSVTIPLWTSGAVAASTAAAQSRLRQVEQQQRSARLRVAQEVRQALAEWNAAREAVSAAAKATAAAREALELARLRFGAGLATNLDTTQAQGLLAESEDIEIRLRYESLLAQAKLSYAQGGVKRFFSR